MNVEQEWQEALHAAYQLAKAERMNEMSGQYVSRFDARGVHPLSELYGRISAFHEVLDLPGDCLLGFQALKVEAKTEAEAEFLEKAEREHEAVFA